MNINLGILRNYVETITYGRVYLETRVPIFNA